MQTEIERMNYGTHDGNCEVRFEMHVVVPHQGCDPIAFADFEVLEHCGQSAGAAVKILIGVAMFRVVRPARDYFNIRKQLPCALKKRNEGELGRHTFLSARTASKERRMQPKKLSARFTSI